MDSLGKNVRENPSQQKKKKVGWQWPTPVITVTAGSINRRITVQTDLDKKQDPISEITRAKRVGGMEPA
jgi:hypothetical protein